MEIAEALKLKKLAEQRILMELQDFEQRTGISVDCLNLGLAREVGFTRTGVIQVNLNKEPQNAQDTLQD